MIKSLLRLISVLVFAQYAAIVVADEPVQVNQNLESAASPYVAMHATDKVRWFAWDKQALLKSQQENKPLLLSIGYFSCYWCHVLQRESFNNDELANFINQHFIPVVVDRELFASLDAYLTRFAEETIGRGGWPLNVVMTPDGYPLMATIYLPPENYMRWLQKAAGLWKEDPEYIRSIAKDAADEMNMLITVQPEKVTDKYIQQVEKKFLAEVMSVADEFQGGFGDQAKFPLPAILQVLLRQYQQHKTESLGHFLELTLDNIASQGLFDHLQGGFFRYTTGPDWQLPHFEKMLYDNAQIAALYLLAGDILDSKRYRQIGIKQLDYLIENFRNDQGAFFAAYSAVDDKGVEGGYYLWSEEQVSRLFNSQEQEITAYYWGWDQPPLLEEGRFPVPHRSFKQVADHFSKATVEIKKIILTATEKLRQQQQTRKLPRDDKLLTAWNALTLIALIEGYESTGLPRFKNAAQSLATFITNKLIDSDQLYRAIHRGQVMASAELEDYAYTATALYRWSKLADNKSARTYRERAKNLAMSAWKRFWNKSGWKMSDTMLIPNLSQEAMIADGPLPSSSAMLIQLGFEMKDEALIQLSKKALAYGHYRLQTAPFWYASYVNVLTSYR